MSSAGLRDVTLAREEYDIVWADLGLGEHVYPLGILGHGRTYEERAVIRRRVYEQLDARGLARGGPDDELAGLLVLLARAHVWLDMQWLSEPDNVETDQAVAARTRERGLIARLDPSGLRLRAVPGTAILPALLDQLPAVGAATGQSISLPRSALSRAVPDSRESIYERPPATSGRFRQQVRALEAVFEKPRLRGGQIVANSRDRIGRRHRSQPLEWFDTPAGRWTARVSPGDRDEHVTVIPADRNKIAGQLHEMLNAVTR